MSTFTTLTNAATQARKPQAFVNARIIDPASARDEAGGLLVMDGMIADIGPHITANDLSDDYEIIDCQQQVLCPGLIDLQVHFREPGFEYKETIHSGSKAAVAGGVTRVVCQPNTAPVIDNTTTLYAIQHRAQQHAYCHIHAYGAITQSLKGEALAEMGLMHEAGAVGFTDDGLPVMNALVMKRAMQYAAQLGVPIAQHAEDLHLSNKGAIHDGEVAARLGLPGIPSSSEAVIVARDLLLQQETGCHYHVLHVSAKETLDLIRLAKENGQHVTCEVTPHHLMLTDDAIEKHGANAKMNPPLRTDADRQALIDGLKDGTIDAIATDHAPHEDEAKNTPIESAAFGVIGLETMLPLSLRLYHDGIMSLPDVLATMTCNAADIIKVNAGKLQKNHPADLTLFDPDEEWVYHPASGHSQSHNSPFAGDKMKGKVTRTVIAGHTVYQNS